MLSSFIWTLSAALQSGLLILLTAYTLANCSKLCARKKSTKTPKTSKTQKTGGVNRTMTTSGASSGAYGGVTGSNSVPDTEKTAALAVTGGDQGKTSTYAVAKTGEKENANNKKSVVGKVSKKGKKKKTTEDADEANAKKTQDNETKEVEYNHENTLRIEMVDDDHTKSVSQSACFDAYDTNAEGGGNLEKKPSKAKQSGKKVGVGKGKKKNATVQSVECGPPEDKDKDKVTKSNKSKKSRRSVHGAHPDGKEKQQHSSPNEKQKMKTADEGETTPQMHKSQKDQAGGGGGGGGGAQEAPMRNEKKTQEDSAP